MKKKDKGYTTINITHETKEKLNDLLKKVPGNQYEVFELIVKFFYERQEQISIFNNEIILIEEE